MERVAAKNAQAKALEEEEAKKIPYEVRYATWARRTWNAKMYCTLDTAHKQTVSRSRENRIGHHLVL